MVLFDRAAHGVAYVNGLPKAKRWDGPRRPDLLADLAAGRVLADLDRAAWPTLGCRARPAPRRPRRPRTPIPRRAELQGGPASSEPKRPSVREVPACESPGQRARFLCRVVAPGGRVGFS
jgi:hypothetical protein